MSSIKTVLWGIGIKPRELPPYFVSRAANSSDARTIGFQFTRKVVYIAIWVAAISLFMELLGFSTQKWLTTRGLGTPFFVNEWIQTRIEGYEVFGTVEHVGWWSSTIIRGDDREVVHIPKHKFTVNVVRNLSQKTHWHIKTHFAIGHLDVNKIDNIIVDMHKVLAKNPQVEQQAMLLDLLRVVNHHQACLAIPIRTVQKEYNMANIEMENIPFADDNIQQGVNPYQSSDKDNLLVLKSNSSIPSRGVTYFTSTVKKLATQNSSIWKFDRNGTADINVGSSKSLHVLASSHNSRQWGGFTNGVLLKRYPTQ
ncbi:hypothetical protein VitviT2T_017007 [Vitis vinifera]|uniref:Uncharacterized protein n=2 Tax=Vitis vinifera TaxID=29760 RepID=A0ABY9CTF8_VITVI|nr:hypothetical protein VitviT2T_017007 [Vitis vinifera]